MHQPACGSMLTLISQGKCGCSAVAELSIFLSIGSPQRTPRHRHDTVSEALLHFDPTAEPIHDRQADQD